MRRIPVVLGVITILAILFSFNWRREESAIENDQRMARESVATTRQPEGAPAGLGASSGHGMVLDRQRRLPIHGAGLVARTLTGTIVAETTSDAAGRFELPCGMNLVLVAKAVGYVSTQASLRCDRENRVALSRGVTVAGHVQWRVDRRPVPSARVSCSEGDTPNAIDAALTLADGSFVLGSCRHGDGIRVWATHPEAPAALVEIGPRVAGSDVGGIDLLLSSGRTVRGRVVDEAGVAVDADVVAIENGDWRRPHVGGTELDGSFSLSIGEEEADVSAIAENGRVASARVPPGMSSPGPLLLVLPRGGRIEGTLLGNADGASVLAYSKRGRLERGSPAWFRETFWHSTRWSDGRGGTYIRRGIVEGNRFWFDGLELGEYRLFADSTSGTGRASIDTRLADVVEIELVPTGSLTISVRDVGGTPLNGSIAFTCGVAGGTAALEEGVAELTKLTPGACVLRAHRQAGPDPAPTHINISVGTNALEWIVSDEPLVYRGLVVDSQTGLALSGAEISTPSEIALGVFTAGAAISITAEDGRFSLEAGHPSALLFVYRPGYRSELVSGESERLVRLTVGPSKRSLPAPR